MNMEDDEPRYAQPPFDNRNADVILQSKDGVIFRVFKVILAQASPVLADTFSAPHPPPEAAQEGDYIDGTPVLRLEESSRTLDIFLRCCYPAARPSLDISDIRELYDAGRKYDAAAVIQYASQELSHFADERDSSLRAYVIACHLKLHDQALSAARKTLELPLQTVIHLVPRFPELAIAPILVSTNLLDYHRKCRSAVEDAFLTPHCWLKDEDWCGSVFEPWDRVHKCCEEDTEIFQDTYYHYVGEQAVEAVDEEMFQAKLWMVGLLRDLTKNLKKVKLSIRDALTDPEALDSALEMAVRCPHCRTTAIPVLTGCMREIEHGIPAVLRKVPLMLND